MGHLPGERYSISAAAGDRISELQPELKETAKCSSY